MSLIDKIRKAREQTVEADGHVFTIRRPTDEEAIGLGNAGLVDVVKRFVVGWNLQEIDIIPGGSAVDVAFDAEVFAEWVADRPVVWQPIAQAVLDAYTAHAKKRDDAVKN